MHDIDIAHAGTYSLYVEGIRRTDRLCAEMWNAIETDPEYSGKTTLMILPDFGRDSDDDPGGSGFQHHRTPRDRPQPAAVADACRSRITLLWARRFCMVTAWVYLSNVTRLDA